MGVSVNNNESCVSQRFGRVQSEKETNQTKTERAMHQNAKRKSTKKSVVIRNRSRIRNRTQTQNLMTRQKINEKVEELEERESEKRLKRMKRSKMTKKMRIRNH